MSSKWDLVSEAWSLNELALIAGDALIALYLLRLVKLKKIQVKINEKLLRDKVASAKKILNMILDEIEMVSKGAYEPTILIKGLQEEYGYKNLNKIKEKILEAEKVLKEIEEGVYEEKAFNTIERILDCIANRAASKFHELVTSIRSF